MQSDKNNKNRIVMIIIIISALLIALSVRLFFLQIVQASWLTEKATAQQTKTDMIDAKRGDILDRNGNKLAVSATVYNLIADPSVIKEENSTAYSEKLASLLNIDKKEIYDKLSNKVNADGKPIQYQLIFKKMEDDVTNAVKKWIADEKVVGFSFEENSKRYYPNNNLAAQVVGFVNDENNGALGIEDSLNDILVGAKGRILGSVDARNNPIPIDDQEYIKAQEGQNVVLTIDSSIQDYVQTTLEKAVKDTGAINGGTAIAMDPKTGEILAMATCPDFNLNDPYAAPPKADTKTWDGHSAAGVNMLQSGVWRNKAISDTYEPGSVFKAITASMGLEENVVKTTDIFSDDPVSLADGTTIRCWTGKGHGNETFAQAMANSCNPVFVRMSERLGGSNNIPVSISKFYSYIKNFGFNDLTGIELPGETNSIFQNKPKMIDMMTASFGQSFTITPIQLIQAYGAIANSGTMNKVHIVKELRDADGNVVKSFEPEALREVVSKETSQTLIDLMKGVITNGTGKNAYIEGYQIAGKTGTSETVESRAGISNRMISSFCAIAPADNPQIVLLVVLDYPTISGAAGEGTAAPVVKDILKNVLPYMGIEKTYTAADVAKIQHTSVMVPVVEGMKLSDAKALLTSKGLSYSVEGDDKSDTAKVVLQTPGKNTYLMQDSRVVLYTYKPESEVTVLVPDVTKQSVDTATNTINYVGLNISISGAGSAVSQTPAAGTLVPKGSVVNVSFK